MYNIAFHACAYAHGKLWFIDRYNNFMNIDTQTWQGSFVNLPTDGEQIDFETVTDTMVTYEDNLFWVGQDGKRLIKYSFSNNRFSFYHMPVLKMYDWTCITTIFVYGEKLYIIPKEFRYMVIFDIETETIHIQNETNAKECVLSTDVRKDEIVYLFPKAGKQIIKFDLENASYSIINYMEDMGNIVSAVSYENNIYLMGENGIYEWDGVSEHVKDIILFDNHKLDFHAMVILGSSILILPCLGNKICIIDKKTKLVSDYMDYPKDFKYLNLYWTRFLGYCENSNYIWYAMRGTNYCLRIDKHSEILEWFKPVPPSFQSNDNLYRKFYKKKLLYESETNLEMFLKIISHNAEKCLVNSHSSGIIGSEIWKMIGGNCRD